MGGTIRQVWRSTSPQKASSGGKGVEFRHSNGSQGIGFGFNTIYATGSTENQPLYLKARGTRTVQLAKQNNSQPDLHVAGGQEVLRMMRGVVAKEGTRFAGEGFTVTPVRDRQGLYDIAFTPPFSSIPGASATQIFSSFAKGNAVATDEGGDTRDNAVITHLSADRMRVKTGASGGGGAQRAFTFVVIGPR